MSTQLAPVVYVSDLCDTVCTNCIDAYEATHPDLTFAVCEGDGGSHCLICGEEV